MLYKVYAKNCVCAKRIQKATQKDLDEVITKVYDRALEAGYIDDLAEDGEEIDQDKVEKHLDMISEYFQKNKSISAGDYMIVDVDSISDIVVPNMCGGDESFIF